MYLNNTNNNIIYIILYYNNNNYNNKQESFINYFSSPFSIIFIFIGINLPLSSYFFADVSSSLPAERITYANTSELISNDEINNIYLKRYIINYFYISIILFLIFLSKNIYSFI